VKVLVTGGNGFIGSHLVMRLLKEEYATTVIDSHADFAPAPGVEKANFVRIGAEDAKCERLFADNLFEVVIHLAYRAPATERSEDATNQFYMNQASLANMLYLSQKYHVRKVIVFSSYEVYGSQDVLPISEEAEPHPCTAVGYHQLSREQLCDEYRQRGLNVIVLRLGCVYGPRQTDSHDHLFHLLPDHVLAFRTDNPYSRQNAMLDYIYVGDVVEAIFQTISRQVSPTLNLSAGIGFSSSDVQECCRKLTEQAADAAGLPVISGDGDAPDASALHQTRIVVESADQNPDEWQPELEAPDFRYVLDIQRIQHELDWRPKFTLEEGMARTLSWHDNVAQRKSDGMAARTHGQPGKHFWNRNRLRYVEVVFFAVAVLPIDYMFNYWLNLRLDFFLLYLVLIGLFYGLRYGIAAIVLSVIARVFLQLVFEQQSLVMQAIDNDLVLQILVYLILGLCISYTMDSKNQLVKNLRVDLTKSNQELGFVNDLYQKSLEVKNNLQYAIENSSNSLGKLIFLVSRLERVEHGTAYDEISQIYADVLRVNHVHVFHADATGQWFRLVASTGEIKYGKSIQSSQFPFLDDVIRGQRIFINRELVKEYPQVCAPIFLNNELEAVVFIDGIEFISLTQFFINTLKSLTVLVSESLERKQKIEQNSVNEKYYSNTLILKKDWFEKNIQERMQSSSSHMLLLKINNEIFNYRSFNRVINNLIRSADSVGEIAKGRLGILLIDTDPKYLPIIKSRFMEKGFSVDLMELERQQQEEAVT
jgi:UDP-glucuronate decarboxylase